MFLCEGMWTRHFPAVREARRLIAAGAIGSVVSVHANFAFSSEPGSIPRIWERALAGGGLLDVGVYALAMASMAFGGRAPAAVVATGALRGGVDATGGAVLRYAASPAVDANKVEAAAEAAAEGAGEAAAADAAAGEAEEDEAAEAAAAGAVAAAAGKGGGSGGGGGGGEVEVAGEEEAAAKAEAAADEEAAEEAAAEEEALDGIAVVSWGVRAATEEACFIAGTAGSIKIPAPMHCPDRVILSTGRANQTLFPKP